MLKEKQLNHGFICFKGLNYDSIDQAGSLLMQAAELNSIPILIGNDTFQTEGFLKTIEVGCLVISHPQHEKDYYKIVIVPGADGDLLMTSIGRSKMVRKFTSAGGVCENTEGITLSMKMKSLIESPVELSEINKKKMNAEQVYYAAVEQLITEVFDIRSPQNHQHSDQ